MLHGAIISKTVLFVCCVFSFSQRDTTLTAPGTCTKRIARKCWKVGQLRFLFSRRATHLCYMLFHARAYTFCPSPTEKMHWTEGPKCANMSFSFHKDTHIFTNWFWAINCCSLSNYWNHVEVYSSENPLMDFYCIKLLQIIIHDRF